TVIIDNADRAPTISNVNHTAAIGRLLSFPLVATDPDLATVFHYSASGLPDGASVDPNTGIVHWTPGPGQAGDYVVNFTVSDGELSTTQFGILRAALSPPAPIVTIELTPSFPVAPG